MLTSNYKESSYNIYIEENEKVFIYNTITGGYINIKPQFISKSDKPKSYKIDFSSIGIKEFECLQSNGFIIKKDFNEFEWLKYRIEKRRFAKKQLYYTIITTYDCNANCEYCFQKRDPKTLSTDQYSIILKHIINDIENNLETSSIVLTFFGGEPFLENSFTNLVSFLSDLNTQLNVLNRNLKFVTKFVTNGSILTDDMISQLKSFNVSDIQVTLDGSRELHNYIKKTDIFDTVIDNIRKMINSEIKVVIRINVSKKNKDDITNLLDYLKIKKLHHHPIYFSPIVNYNENDDLQAFNHIREFAVEHVFCKN